MPTKKTDKAPQNKKGKSRTTVTNKVTIDPNNPIPFDFSGTALSLVNRNRYLPFLPPKDNYAQNLLEARLLSVTHNACITTKKDYCAGIGFQDDNGKEFEQPILDWFSSMNLKNQNATALRQKMFEDFFTWGNDPIEIVRFTSRGKKKLFVYVHSFLEWRLGEPNEDDIVEYAVQSKLFYRAGLITPREISKAKKLPLYNPMNPERKNWIRDEKGTERTMIWNRNEVSGIPHYGLPSSVAAMIYEMLEYKGARYNYDNMLNNMVAGAILALKGSVGQDEAARIAKEIITTHTGEGKIGRTMVVASEEGIDGSDYHQMDIRKEGSFNESDSNWTQKIILANEWDAILAGLLSPATLGKGSGFITKIYEIKLNSVIRPAQRKQMENVWDHIFKIAQEWLGLPFDKYKISIKNSIDISGLTDVDVTPAVTRNEVRKAKGLPEDTTAAGNEYMKSTGPQKPQKEKEGEDV